MNKMKQISMTRQLMVTGTPCKSEPIIPKNKNFVMNTTAGYVIMFIQNDIMTCKDVI